MTQEHSSNYAANQPIYGTFPSQSQPVMGFPQPVVPLGASIFSPQNPQSYYAVPVGYQAYGTVVEGQPLGEPRLPCCGIGIGWMLFLSGFFLAAIPWYVGVLILFCVRTDDREKAGLIACTIAAILVALAIIFGVMREDYD